MTVEITPEDLHDATMLLLERTFMLTDDVIHAAKSSQNKEIDEIILVGGGSKMLQVKEPLESRYNKPVNVFEPEFAVAKGAALFANRLE